MCSSRGQREPTRNCRAEDFVPESDPRKEPHVSSNAHVPPLKAPAWATSLSRVCYGLLFILLLVLFSFFVYRFVKLASYRWSVEYNEGYVFVVSDLLSRGHDIYHPLSEPPFVVPFYTPIFYLLSALAIKLFGLSFGAGRVISAAAAFATGLIIFFDARRQTSELFPPLIAMLFFFSIPVVYLWAPLMRVDALATAFCIGGLYFVCSTRRFSVMLSCILFILALYTKQNMIWAPFVAFLYLLLNRERKKAIHLFLGMLVLGSVILLICGAVWGTDFFRHVFLYNLNKPYGVNLLDQYARILREQFILIALAATWCIVSFRNRRIDVFPLYFVVTGISTLGFIKIGASINFFYEFAAACCLMIVPAICGFRSYLEKTAKTAFVPLIPLLLLIQGGLLYHRPYENAEFIKTPQTHTDSINETIASYLSTKESPSIAFKPEFVLFSGQEVYIDVYFFNRLATQGQWDESNFLQEIDGKLFSAIIVPFDIARPELAPFKHSFFAKYFFDDNMKKAILGNYRPIFVIGDYYIYTPK